MASAGPAQASCGCTTCVDGKDGRCGCGADCKCPQGEQGCCVKAGCFKSASCQCAQCKDCDCGADCKCPGPAGQGCCDKSGKSAANCGCASGKACTCGANCQCGGGCSCSAKAGCCSGAKKIPKLVLTYFDFPGRAAPIRYAFQLGKVPFEDVRLGFPEFGALKQSGAFPFGSIPVLDVDGFRISDSNSILFYAGSLAGLVPKDPFLAARTIQTMNAVEDFYMSELKRTMAMVDKSEEQLAARAKIANESLPAWLRNMVKLLTANGTGFFVGDSLSVADLKTYGAFNHISSGRLTGIAPAIFESVPELVAFRTKIHDILTAAGVKLM